MAVNDALNIRPVAPSDLEAWRPLWDGYNAFYGRNGPTALPEEVTAVTWARFFNPLEPVFALVAENEGKLLGLAHYLFHRSTTRVEPVCYLQDLFTASPARGQGVGRALIEGVYRQAVLAGAKRVYWQTQAVVLFDNLPGYPDNLTRGRDGRIWAGFAKPRNATLDALADKPFLRKLTLRLPRAWWPIPKPYGHVFAFTEDGRIVSDLQDPDGAYPESTGVTETAERLYIQSLHAGYLGWMANPLASGRD